MSRVLLPALLVLAARVEAASAPTSQPADPALPGGEASAIAAFQGDEYGGCGRCRPRKRRLPDRSGGCTLPAAIQESNAVAGENTINLPAGTYPLTLPPRPGKDDANRSHAITGSLRLIGANTATTIIDGIVLPEFGLRLHSGSSGSTDLQHYSFCLGIAGSERVDRLPERLA
jgi:hypothetical protein